MNLWFGFLWRGVAFLCLTFLYREKMGLRSYASTLAEYTTNPALHYFEARINTATETFRARMDGSLGSPTTDTERLRTTTNPIINQTQAFFRNSSPGSNATDDTAKAKRESEAEPVTGGTNISREELDSLAQVDPELYRKLSERISIMRRDS